MLTPRTASLLTLLLAVGSLGQRAQRPPRPPSPISTVQPKANFDAQQFSGTWFLVAVASSCRSLQEQGHRAEATTLHVTPQGAAMAVSTFRKLPRRPRGGGRGRRGDGLPRLRHPVPGAGAAAVGEAVRPAPRAPCPPSPHPPSGRPGAPCVPHAARSLPVSESFLSVFEQRVQGANLTEDHTLFFPKYGFCEAADQFHVLDGERAAPAGRCGRGLAARGSLLVESRLCCRSEEVRPAAALHREAAKALEEAAPATPLAEWGTLSRPPPKPHLTPRSSGRCLH
eukprot:XP_028342707.1 complement component C8 gamma chain isoform X1 [Physeter catodon]